MAQTTTAINACDVSVWLDDDANTLKDISGSSNSLDMNFEVNIGEFVAFGGCWPGRLQCGKDAAFTLNAIYTTTADEAWDILKTWYFSGTCAAQARTFDVYIPTKNVGSDYFTMEVLLSSLSWTADRGEAGPIMVTAEFLPSGAVTHSVAAT